MTTAGHEALQAGREALAAYAKRVKSSTLHKVASEMLSVKRTFADEPQLRRALTDPARKADDRAGLAALPAPAGGGSSAAAPQSEHLPSCPPGAGCCCCFAAAGRPGWARREGTGCAASRVPGARLCLTAGRGAAAGRAGLSAGGGPAPLRSAPLPSPGCWG